MNQRLPWKRRPAGGYIAYPDGEDHPRRVAEITPRERGNGGATWNWSVSYDGAWTSNTAESSQQAADHATAAWPKMMAEAARRAEEEREKEEVAEIVQQAARTGDVSALEVETASDRKLLLANRYFRDIYEARPWQEREGSPLHRAMLVVSAEFAARRKRGDPPAS